MTKEELQNAIKDEVKASKIRIIKLEIEYAKERNHVQVGDIITDDNITLKVDRIEYNTYLYPLSMPFCIYWGTKLTKSGTPYKRDWVGTISQNNLKTINGKPIADYADQTRE